MTEVKPGSQPIGKRIRRWAVEGLILLLVLFLVHLWQTRDSIEGPSPTLSARLISGQTFNLDVPRDKPLLVYFWATWCPVCTLTSEKIDELADNYTIVTVAMRSGNAEEITAYLQKKDLHFPVIPDPQGRISREWRVKGVPTLYFMDTSGDIRFVSVGYISTLGMKARMWLTERLPASG